MLWIKSVMFSLVAIVLAIVCLAFSLPSAMALFPAEMLAWPPRSYVERIYNVAQWTEMPRGGHFAALEAPDLLVSDIQKFARLLRKSS